MIADFVALEKELDALLEEHPCGSDDGSDYSREVADYQISLVDRVYELLCIVEADLRRLDPSIPPVFEDYGSWVLLQDVIHANPTRVVAGLRFLRCHMKLMENTQVNIARLASRAELKRRFLSPTGSARPPAAHPLPQLQLVSQSRLLSQSKTTTRVVTGGCSRESLEMLRESLETLPEELAQHEAAAA